MFDEPILLRAFGANVVDFRDLNHHKISEKML
jgi:hypothetical protein